MNSCKSYGKVLTNITLHAKMQKLHYLILPSLPKNNLSKNSPNSLNHSQLKQEIWANAHETCESLQQFQFSSLAKNWGVHAKLIYRYQILYLDRITVVPWRHLVNDIDLCRSPKSPKKTSNPLLGRSTSFKVIEFSANWEPVYDFLLVINSNLGHISHRYWDRATYWPKIANFTHPSLI